jgi:hypothetical protein
LGEKPHFCPKNACFWPKTPLFWGKIHNFRLMLGENLGFFSWAPPRNLGAKDLKSPTFQKTHVCEKAHVSGPKPHFLGKNPQFSPDAWRKPRVFFLGTPQEFGQKPEKPQILEKAHFSEKNAWL